MKIENMKLSVNELLLIRQWLSIWEGVMTIESKFIHQATDAKKAVDKLLWRELISNETPWGICEETVLPVVSFSDDNFEETIKTILGKEEVDGVQTK